MQKRLLTWVIIPALLGIGAAVSEEVVYNARTKTFHKPTCHWAESCRRGCEKMERSEAIKRGGAPCKSCGG